jgi:hypothetical protein
MQPTREEGANQAMVELFLLLIIIELAWVIRLLSVLNSYGLTLTWNTGKTADYLGGLSEARQAKHR